MTWMAMRTGGGGRRRCIGLTAGLATIGGVWAILAGVAVAPSAAEDPTTTTTEPMLIAPAPTSAPGATTTTVLPPGPTPAAYPDPLDDHANEVALFPVLGRRFGGTWQFGAGQARRVRVTGIEPTDLARVEAALGRTDVVLVESTYSIADLRAAFDELLAHLHARANFGISIDVIGNQVQLVLFRSGASADVVAWLDQYRDDHPDLVRWVDDVLLCPTSGGGGDGAGGGAGGCPSLPSFERPPMRPSPAAPAPAAPIPARPSFTG